MGCTHSRVGPAQPQSPTIRKTRFSRFKKKWFLPKREPIPDKTTIMVGIDHSGKLSAKLEEKKRETGWRRSDMKSVMTDQKSLKRTAFGFARRDVVPPIQKEEEVEITVVYTAPESKIIIDPSHMTRDDGFRVVEKKFTVPKSDKSSRNIIEGLSLFKRKDKTSKTTECKEAEQSTSEQGSEVTEKTTTTEYKDAEEPTREQDAEDVHKQMEKLYMS